MRWIREGQLVFVKWMDTREVSVCSTIHPAFSGETVQRRVKTEDGRWAMRDIPCPTPITAYNRNMAGVDLSDQITVLLHPPKNLALVQNCVAALFGHLIHQRLHPAPRD